MNWLTTTNQHLLPSKSCTLNGSVFIDDLMRLKLQMKDVLTFLEYAKILKEKWNVFDENSDSKGIERKVQESKDQTQLIVKLDNIITQVNIAKKHFGM